MSDLGLTVDLLLKLRIGFIVSMCNRGGMLVIELTLFNGYHNIGGAPSHWTDFTFNLGNGGFVEIGAYSND